MHPLDGKIPILKGWPEKATTDPEEVKAFWTEHPSSNIGISAEGLLILDVDPAQWRG